MAPIEVPRRATPPTFYLLAGPNGAGKSTLYRALVEEGLISSELEFVNADVYEREALSHVRDARARSAAAREWADGRRARLLREGRSFVSETVFSHPSKLALIRDAQKAGLLVVLIVVAMDGPERLIARVAQRVSEGGHDVPVDKILERYPRTLANLGTAVRLADMALLYDSQDVAPGTHALVATCRSDTTRVLCQPLPAWAAGVLGLTPSTPRSRSPSPARRG